MPLTNIVIMVVTGRKPNKSAIRSFCPHTLHMILAQYMSSGPRCGKFKLGISYKTAKLAASSSSLRGSKTKVHRHFPLKVNRRRTWLALWGGK